MLLLLKFGLLLIVFLTPLLTFSLELGYEETKVRFFTVSVILLLIFWAVLILKKNKKANIKISVIKILLALFTLSLLITSFLGMDLEGSLIGKSPYFQGFITYFLLFLFFLLISTFKIKFIQL